jgi:hypothetical protein
METWKNVNDYYEVSNTGNVRRIGKDTCIVGCITKAGYRQVLFSINGKVTHKLVHRLIAEAFISNPNNLPQVNHKDENKLNNNVENLEWCSPKYNMNYGTARERHVAHHDYHSHNMVHSNDFRKKTVIQRDMDGKIINTFFGLAAAGRQTGYRFQNISKCWTGELKTYKGFLWTYCDQGGPA